MPSNTAVITCSSRNGLNSTNRSPSWRAFTIEWATSYPNPVASASVLSGRADRKRR